MRLKQILANFRSVMANPRSVLVIAFSLAFIGLLSALMLSILHLRMGDPWYLVIFIVSVTFGVCVLKPMMRPLKEALVYYDKQKERDNGGE